MNILFISQQNYNKWSGPTYSIPSQVNAIAKYDNVLWYNLVNENINEWKKIPIYRDLNSFPSMKISDLPNPFNKPDLIVVEQFYKYGLNSILFQLLKGKTPYIIIPRGELTKGAQKISKIKKRVANLLVYNKFAKRAIGIIYLSDGELKSASKKWNNCSFVIPNGISNKESYSTEEHKSINYVGVGRIATFHKGLDLLLEACKILRDFMIDNSCKISIYGPDYKNSLRDLNDYIVKNDLSPVINFNGPVYDEEKENKIKESDIFILTSRFEGMPMSAIEALSYGKPLIVTEGSNLKEMVDSYDAGWTAFNNVESVKNAILKSIQEREKYKKKSLNALNLANEFSWDKIALTTHNIFKELLSYEKKKI